MTFEAFYLSRLLSKHFYNYLLAFWCFVHLNNCLLLGTKTIRNFCFGLTLNLLNPFPPNAVVHKLRLKLMQNNISFI